MICDIPVVGDRKIRLRVIGNVDGGPTPPPPGVNYYILDTATGDDSGSDWTNAFPEIPATLEREATYWIARGSGASFGTYFFDDVEDGVKLITFRVATISDHGISTGWNNAFAGQVLFDNWIAVRDYYEMDGNKRDENDWDDPTEYGFRVAGAVASHNDTFPPGGDHWILMHTDIGGDEGDTFVPGIPNDAVDLVNISGSAEVNDWQIHKCRLHNARVGLTLVAANTIDVFDTMFVHTFDKEAIIGLGSAKNVRVLRCKFKDCCLDSDSTTGATAIIGAWGDGSSAGDWDNWQVGNCAFWNTVEIHHSDGVILIGGDGVTWLGAGTSGTKIYNNSFFGILSGVTNIQINGTGNNAHNNLAYSMAGTFSMNVDNESNNSLELLDPYVDSLSGDFHLGLPLPGIALGAGYSAIDLDGLTRTITWDLGAYKFVA